MSGRLLSRHSTTASEANEPKCPASEISAAWWHPKPVFGGRCTTVDAPVHAGKLGLPRSKALFYRIVAEYVRSGCSVIAEAAFHTDFAHDPAELLRQAHLCIVHCGIDRATARQRFIDRASTDPLRLQAHPDWEIVEAMNTGTFDWDKYEPMNLGIPVLRVDTTAGYTPPFDELEVFSRGR